MCFQDVAQAYINIEGLPYPVILELQLAESLLAREQDPTLLHLIFCTSVPYVVPQLLAGDLIRPPPGPPPRVQ